MQLDLRASKWTVDGDPDYPAQHLLSDMFESDWLPVVGPSGIALVRYCARRVTTEGAFSVEPCELAYRLGIIGAGKRSPFTRSLQRAESFDLIRLESGCTFRLHVPAEPPAEQDSHRQRRRIAFRQALEASA